MALSTPYLCEYSSVTTTSGECQDEEEISGVFTPVAEADNHISEIVSSIPPLNPEVLPLKNSAFQAQLLMEHTDLFEPTSDGSHDRAVF